MLMGGPSSCGCVFMRCPTFGDKISSSMGNLNRHHLSCTALTLTLTLVPMVSVSTKSGQSSSEMGIRPSVSHPQSTSAPWYSSSDTIFPSSSSPMIRSWSCLRERSPVCLTASLRIPSESISSATARESAFDGMAISNLSCDPKMVSSLTPTNLSAPPSTADAIS